MRSLEATPTASRGPLARAAAFRLLSLVLALNGCAAVGPDFEIPKADLQKNWMETDDPRVETQTAMQQRTDWGRLLPPPPAPDTLNPPPPARDIPVLQKPDW